MKNEVTITPVGNGGGWYHITKNGYVKAVARGMKQAQQKAEEVRAQPESLVDIYFHLSQMIKKEES